MRSVFVGGGVAGCALAAALRGGALGERSTIVERRQAGAPAGMGFILMPNGLEALEKIAPETDWRAAGRTIDRVLLRSAHGTVLSDHAVDAGVCVGRKQFLELLRAATGRCAFLEAASVRGFVRGSNGLASAVALEDGTEVEGDAFFGCDGAQSLVRSLIFPTAVLEPVVVQEVVSVAHSPALAERLGTTFHKFHDEEGGLAVGVLAEGADRVVWFVQFDSRRWPDVAATAECLRRFVCERVAVWSEEVHSAVEATDFRQSHLWPTRDLRPLATLSSGNVALVGDAAHACLPFTSQGANGALADAALLKDLLGEVSDQSSLQAALARYTELRVPHHRRMFDEGRWLRDAFLAPLARQHPVVPLVA